jgi:hypothetical protein
MTNEKSQLTNGKRFSSPISRFTVNTSLNAGPALWRSGSSRPGFAKFATPDLALIGSGLSVSRSKSLDKAASDQAKQPDRAGTWVASQREVVSATRQAPMNYALLTKNNLTDPIIAEEKYEKDFRIRDTGRFHAGWRNRLRLYARHTGQGAGQDGVQEKDH